MVLCFVFLALIPAGAANLGQIAYTAAITFSGLNSVGIMKSAQLVNKYILRVLFYFLFFAKLFFSLIK